ncbi:MAG: hypothetical protein ACFE9Q_17490, partial [Candidatus Hodarchaeota archaeon]
MINIEIITWVAVNPVLLFLIQCLIKSSAIFTILFLPSYPLFFVLLKNKDFHFREKVGFTIVSNLSFYIIIGYIGSWMNLPITFEYFFFILLLTYFLLILIVIFRTYRRGTVYFFQKAKNFDDSPLHVENLSFSGFLS